MLKRRSECRHGVLAVVLLVTPVVLTGLPVDLGPLGRGEYVTRWAVHAEDTTNTATAQEVAAGSLPWTPIDGEIAGYGYTRSAHWFRIDFTRPSGDGRRMAVVFWHIHVDEIEVRILDELGRVEAIHTTGDAVPAALGGHPTRNMAIPLPESGRFTLLVREHSTNSLLFAPAIWEVGRLQEQESRDTLVLGVVFGFLGLMILYNILMYFSTRYVGHLWYALYLVAMGLFQLVYVGVGRQLVWPAHALQNLFDVPSLALLVAASMAFAYVTNAFSELPTLRVVYLVLAAADLLGLGLWAAGLRRESLVVVNTLLVVMTAVTMAGGLVQAYRGRRYSRFFSVAWFFVLSSGLYSALSSLGVVHDFRLATTVLLLGTLFEIIILSIALADTVTGLRRTVDQQRERILRSEHLAAVATAASSIAHEVANPTYIISANTTLLTGIQDGLSRRIRETGMEGVTLAANDPVVRRFHEDVPGMLADIQGAAARIGDVVERYRGTAAALTETRIPCDLGQQVREVLRLNDRAIRRATRGLDLRLPPGEVVVVASPLRLQQLLTNLLTNALQALETREQTVAVALDRVGGQAILTVRDQGRGMDRVTLARLGEPFFSTRQGTGGSGLGLMICFDIVRELRGTLRFESTPGAGTTAVVSLPAARPAGEG